MDAPMWFTMLIIIKCFSQYFVWGAELGTDEKGSDQLSTNTVEEISKITDGIANTLLINSSTANVVYILNTLENKFLKASEHLGPKSKKIVELILEAIKLKVFNKTKDRQTITEDNTAEEVDVSENNYQHGLVTQISYIIESLIKNQFDHFDTSEIKENKIINSDTVNLKDFLVNDSHSNNSRRVAGHATEVKSLEDSKTDDADTGSVIQLHQNINNINNYETSTEQSMPLICHNLINRTCEDIKNMNRLKCRYEQNFITLDKLCDGAPDCLFKSDEINCYSQVMEQFLYYKQVEACIEPFQYSKCFVFDASRSVLSNQANTLRNLLEKELNFKTKYSYLNSTFHKTKIAGYEEREASQEKMANNIALVISSLALALDGALCSNKLGTFDTRRTDDLFDIDLDKEFKESLSPPEGCKCKEESCFNCTHYCQRLCKQKNSLSNWVCESVNGTSMVSLNLICDGKLDCFDESDEQGCDTGTGKTKFEAIEIYSSILNMLELKASRHSQPIHKKFLLLSESIMKLQTLTTKTVPKLETIKKLRDKCYSMLRNIYTDIVKQLDIGKKAEEAYFFLLSINQKLGTALKLSHTGNAKILGHGCNCTNGTCSTSFCSKNCIKICAVEPMLMRYYCYGKFNKSVTVDKICDGVKDCSNAYDELNCKKDEICRHHHLIVLKNNLQSIGENLKGTALGELLSLWKLKVFSTLKIFEKKVRPSPQELKNIVEDILRDLFVTYGSVKTNKRSTADYVLKIFLNISQIILESIKSCRK